MSPVAAAGCAVRPVSRTPWRIRVRSRSTDHPRAAVRRLAACGACATSPPAERRAARCPATGLSWVQKPPACRRCAPACRARSTRPASRSMSVQRKARASPRGISVAAMSTSMSQQRNPVGGATILAASDRTRPGRRCLQRSRTCPYPLLSFGINLGAQADFTAPGGPAARCAP